MIHLYNSSSSSLRCVSIVIFQHNVENNTLSAASSPNRPPEHFRGYAASAKFSPPFHRCCFLHTGRFSFASLSGVRGYWLSWFNCPDPSCTIAIFLLFFIPAQLRGSSLFSFPIELVRTSLCSCEVTTRRNLILSKLSRSTIRHHGATQWRARALERSVNSSKSRSAMVTRDHRP